MDDSPSEYVLDACSLLNLIASGRFDEIAQAIPAEFVIVRQAASEISFLRRGGEGPDSDERDSVSLYTLERSGFLTVVELTTATELSDFVGFAVEMDDGEAATGAIALSRGAIVVTDDRKAQRIFSTQYPTLTVRTTPNIMKTWADRTDPSANELARVLKDIETRARFRPRSSDMLANWWANARGR